ncbi:winged helix-turn-helix transcriptional regulator [Natronomonas salina]|uniref:winged helix-turn-helix transcriptional regulator n=1 Tax=Natronomonas salina TaxID=1710540 RepID=UPI0015B5C8CD|nr:helix-turn-helix domain-containing protein [Natronomonas salina]QLD89013.1 winged helix-turn-helix transcriptional regulator [Natronomonas salina]
MERTGRTVVATCLVLLVAAAPFATTASAAISATGADASSGDEGDGLGLSITDTIGNVTNATGETVRATVDATDDAVENATNGSLAVVETETDGRSDPGREGQDDLGGDEGATSSGDATRPSDEAADPPQPRLRSLLALEVPRLTVSGSAVEVEVRTGSTVGDRTLRVPLDGDGLAPRSRGKIAHEETTDTEIAPVVAADDTAVAHGEASPPTPTQDVDGSGSAEEGSGAGPEAATGTDGFDPAAPLDVAPALGTALFAVAAGPWVGALSGAASAASGWAGRAFVLFRYRSRDGSDPLEHETRERIHDLVGESPGRTLTELAEALDTPLSTVRHHVKILERERVVVSRKLRGNRRLYPLGAENEQLAAALREESSAAVLETLHEQGRATVGDVVDRVEKSYSTVSYHLSRLADEGLVVQERDGRRTVSRLDPAVESLLDAPDERRRAGAERAGREAGAD